MKKSQILIAKAVISIIISIILIVAVVWAFFSILNSFTKDIESNEDLMRKTLSEFTLKIRTDFHKCNDKNNLIYFFVPPTQDELDFIKRAGGPEKVDNVCKIINDSWELTTPVSIDLEFLPNFAIASYYNDSLGSLLFAVKKSKVDKKDIYEKYSGYPYNEISYKEPFIIGETLYSQVSGISIPSFLSNENPAYNILTKVFFIDFDNKEIKENFVISESGQYCGIRIFDNKNDGEYDSEKGRCLVITYEQKDTPGTPFPEATNTEVSYLGIPLGDIKLELPAAPPEECNSEDIYSVPSYSEFYIFKKDYSGVYSCIDELKNKYFLQKAILTGEENSESDTLKILYEYYGNLTYALENADIFLQ